MGAETNSNKGSTWDLWITRAVILMNNGIVTKVNGLEKGPAPKKYFLPTEGDLVTNYTPTYDYHPATKKYVDGGIEIVNEEVNKVKSDLENISIPDYSVIETEVTEGYSKTYSLTKDGEEVGVKINIPKDLVVNKGNVKVVETESTPYEGATIGDKYLDIELNDPTKDHIYIPVKELVDVYTAGDGIEIDASNVIKSKNSNLVNGKGNGSLRSKNSAPETSTYELGNTATALGNDTKASGPNSLAEGSFSESSGPSSHAEGSWTKSNGSSSHAEGTNTIASCNNSHVQGKYNIEDTAEKYAHIVGNGDENSRSNAHTIDWEGNGWFQGNVKVGGTSQDDENSKQLATEEYVNGKINTVGGGIFFWDGKSSTENPDNLELWQRVYDTIQIQPSAMVVIQDAASGLLCNDRQVIFTVNKDMFFNRGRATISSELYCTRSITDSDGSCLQWRQMAATVRTDEDTGKVTSCVVSDTPVFSSPKYLSTNTSSTNLEKIDFTPTHDMHPTTKKYVDDSINNSKIKMLQYDSPLSSNNKTEILNALNDGKLLMICIDRCCLLVDKETTFMSSSTTDNGKSFRLIVSDTNVDVLWTYTKPVTFTYTNKTSNYLDIELDDANYGFDNEDIQIFLNGEKLVGKTDANQDISEYSYYISEGNHQIYFTNDYSIVEDDVIEVIYLRHYVKE